MHTYADVQMICRLIQTADCHVVDVQVTCPQLFLPAGNDPAETKEGGLASQTLGDKIQVQQNGDQRGQMFI
jgi:hypothetical protein